MPANSPIQVLGRLEGGINDLAILDANSLLTAGTDGTILRWNIHSSAPDRPWIHFDAVKRYPKEPPVQMSALALAHTTDFLACALKHGVVEIRNLQTGNLIRSLDNPQVGNKHPFDFCSLAFNPQNPRELAGTNRNYAVVWNIETGQIILRDHEFRAANTVAFLRNGTKLLAQEWDPWLHLYEWPGAKRIRWQYELMESSYNFLTSRAAPRQSPFDFVLSALDADGGHLIAMNLDQEEALWESHLPDRQHDIDIAPDAKLIITGGDDGILRAIDSSGDEQLSIDLTTHPDVASEAESAGDPNSSGLILTTNDLEDDAYPTTAIHRLKFLPNAQSAVIALVGGLLLHVQLG
jgi:WD40 repeat protein